MRMMEQTKSFYELISEYIIEAPIIQREYAQGRTTDKVKSIRKRFVTDLVKAITNDQEIHLGFVYGKIEGKENLDRKILNKEAITSILDAVKFYANNLEFKITANIEEKESEENNQSYLKFIPLDGQQRLTTLYLMNWYLYFKGAKSENIEWLNHFKYSNRKSSLAFCKELVSVSNITILKQKQIKNKGASISELISNSSFFLKKWNKDATVSGMLEMLYSIENAFDSNFDFSNIQIEKLPFTFDFMDLDSLNQTDDLYVKMNSRGKHLSDYEHFKSWLQEKHSDKSNEDWMKSFWLKLDTDWLNYFWRNIDADFNALDDFFYNYIKNLALTFCLANNKNIPFEKLKDIYNLIRNNEVYDAKKISYIPFDKYFIKWVNKIDEVEKEEEFFVFNIEALKFIEKSFDSLIYLEHSDNYDNLDLGLVICDPFVEKNLKPTEFFVKTKLFTPNLWHSVYYYSFIILINERDNDKYEVDRLKDWFRFSRNIIYNTSTLDNPESFNTALKQINNLSSYKFDINNAVVMEQIQNVFFDKSQFEEEKIKMKLFNISGWQDQITQIENHSYLYGQIKFVLDFSKDEAGNYNLEDFIKYSNGISRLYKKQIRLTDDKILERFLLCEDFYLPYYKSDYIFCSGSLGGLRTKNENWRQFFKGNKIETLKKALDKLNGQEVSRELLLDFINVYLKNNQLELSNWKYLFLKYPQAISFCTENAIRSFSDNDIRLLKGFQITAYHTELRTYCFYLEHKNSNARNDNRIAPSKFLPFTKFWYFKDKNTDGHPGIYLDGFKYKNKEYKLVIRYSKDIGTDEFELCFFHKTDEIENRFSDIELEINDFNFNDEFKHYFKIVDYNSLENELIRLCKELVKINSL